METLRNNYVDTLWRCIIDWLIKQTTKSWCYSSSNSRWRTNYRLLLTLFPVSSTSEFCFFFPGNYCRYQWQTASFTWCATCLVFVVMWYVFSRVLMLTGISSEIVLKTKIFVSKPCTSAEVAWGSVLSCSGLECRNHEQIKYSFDSYTQYL